VPPVKSVSHSTACGVKTFFQSQSFTQLIMLVKDIPKVKWLSKTALAINLLQHFLFCTSFWQLQWLLHPIQHHHHVCCFLKNCIQILIVIDELLVVF
jgi:hypothetical protein